MQETMPEAQQEGKAMRAWEEEMEGRATPAAACAVRPCASLSGGCGDGALRRWGCAGVCVCVCACECAGRGAT